MPIVNGDYRQLTADEIREALETELQNEFGADIDLTESSVFTTLAEVIATVNAENTEQSLAEVYQSAFLDTAEDEDLEKVVAIVGLQRRSAIHATGVQRFRSDDPVVQDYNIQSGTTVQTDSDDPIQFETTSTASLAYITGFENQNTDNLNGDTGAAAFNTTDPFVGDAALELNGNGNHIFHDEAIEQGSEIRYRVQTPSGGVPIVTFGVQDVDNHYQVALDTNNSEVRLERVESGTVSQTLDTDSGVTIPTGEYLDVEVDWRADGELLVDVRDDDEGAKTEENATSVATLGGTDSTWNSGQVGFDSAGSGSMLFDETALAAVSANIRAITGGAEGNVGSQSITNLPSVPAGVDTTTNIYPTGSTDFNDLDENTFVVGQDEESDDSLRERATEAVSAGGAATHDALVNALLNDLPTVSSVTVFENKTDTDNTGTGGLPPHSFEAVVFGGDDIDIAETIFETKAHTARDYGGANGTAVSETVTAESNGQTFTINFSRPTKLDIDITADIVVDDTYVGDDEVRDLIVEYIGGTLTDGTSAVGLGVGEDVRIDTIEDIIVGDETGVVGFNKTASTEDVTTTPSKTTNGDGLEIVSVGSNEVAQTDATDASITLNTNQI